MLDQMSKEEWIKKTMEEINVDEALANKIYLYALHQRTTKLMENPLVRCASDELVKTNLNEYGLNINDFEGEDKDEFIASCVELVAEVVDQLDTYTPSWKQGKSFSQQINQVVDHAHNGNKKFDAMLLRLN